MILILGTVRLPPENLETAKPIMQRMIEATRAEAGCIEYGYALDLLDPGLVHVKERWTDQQALDRHFASPHIAEWRSSAEQLGIGDRDLRICEITDERAL